MWAFHFLLVGGSSVQILRCYSSISTPWCLVSSNIDCHDVPIDRCPLSSGISQLYGRIVPITTINHHFFEWYNGIISPFWRVKFHFNPHGCEPSSTRCTSRLVASLRSLQQHPLAPTRHDRPQSKNARNCEAVGLGNKLGFSRPMAAWQWGKHEI